MRRGTSNLAIDSNQVVLTYVLHELPPSKYLGYAYYTPAHLVRSGGPNSLLIDPKPEHEVIAIPYTLPARRYPNCKVSDLGPLYLSTFRFHLDSIYMLKDGHDEVMSPLFVSN